MHIYMYVGEGLASSEKQIFPATKIHFVELPMAMFSTNQLITTPAVSMKAGPSFFSSSPSSMPCVQGFESRSDPKSTVNHSKNDLK